MDTVKRAEELAHERGMSLHRLCLESGLGCSTLKAAKNRGRQLRVETIECICVALDITLAEFFKESNAE